MDNIKCSNCNNEISKKAITCPACGHPNKQTNNAKLSILIIIALVLSALLFLDDGRFNRNLFKETVQNNLDDIHEKVISDQIKQYEIAKRQGDPIQICVQAGLVTAAYLQAKYEYRYREWKEKESSDCKRAGINK